MTSTMIALRDVAKRFDGTGGFAVRGFSLEVGEGETAVLVGPSGSGKTTILRMINRLIEPSSGEIEVGGRDVMAGDPVALRRGIGYVIQSIGLMPHRTVAQNIGLVPRLMGWDAPRVRARVAELATMLELDDELLARFPAELSGGQRQRVGVARALGVDPPVLLMDEPFGAVDPIVRSRLQDQLLALQARLRKTIILVTHDIDEAMRLGDRIAIINRGGHLEQYAPPADILRAPASAFVADFVGHERGLKRLALMQVGQLEAGPGPRVAPGAPAAAVLAAVDGYGGDWAAVVSEEGALLGWVDRSEVGAGGGLAEAGLHPFSVVVNPSSSLREALDAIVTSRTHVAAVVDQGRYVGIVSLDQITRALSGP